MANIALSPDYTILSKDLTGTKKVRTVQVVFDPAKTVGADTACTYTTAGVPLSLGQMGLRRLDSLAIVGIAAAAGTAATTQFIAEWDGDRTTPKIALYTESAVAADAPFTELSSAAVLPALITFTLLVRGV